MTIGDLLDTERRALLAAAGVPVLMPLDGGQGLVAGVQTTVRAGRRRLVAVDVRCERAAVGVCEIRTIARAFVLDAIPADERGAEADGAHVADYLEREARSGLALRTLALGDGEAERLTIPLDRLIAARRDELPPARQARVQVDGRVRDGGEASFRKLRATWIDLADEGIAAVAYATGRDLPDLVTSR